MSMTWQHLQHDQNPAPRSYGSIAAAIAEPRASTNKLGAVLIAAVTLSSRIRLGATLMNPTGQATIARPRPSASGVCGGWCSTARRTLPTREADVVARIAVRVRTRSSPDSKIRRQAFWDDLIDSGAREKSVAKEKGKKNTYVSPVPEGFPPAKTLLRPEEVGYSQGNFLDASTEKFVKNDPSLWQSLRFRLKPFGRIASRTRVVKITLGDRASLSLVPKPSFIGMSDLDLFGCTTALKTAAHDPRIRGVLLDLASVELSTATVMEVRRAMDYFTQSGKPLWGFTESSLDMTVLNLMGGCTRRIAAPGAYVNLIGFSFDSEFYRGFFDKIGIEPQVRRIGEFKSFGDTYARGSMSDAQREVTESLLSAVSGFKVGLLARDAGRKSVSEVEGLYNNDEPITVETLKDFGLLDDIYYEDQILDMFNREIDRRYAKNFFGGIKQTKKPTKKKRLIDVSKTIIPATTYLRRTRRNVVEGVPGKKGDKIIAVLNAEGAIVNTAAAAGSQGNLVVENFRRQVKAVLQDASIEGVVVRISSPGGDALASDLMWREVRRLREAGKSVVASVCNVAASGGYYIAMGCETIVCDELSITGSIGVVQAKFAIGELIDKIGVKIERISKGKYAELFAPERGFTLEEDVYWSKNAMNSYNDFVAKAAMSRRMPVEEMQRRAQGRVWTGAQAKSLGLVDELGGLDRAIEVCRDMIDLKSLAATKLKAAQRKRRKQEEQEKKSAAAKTAAATRAINAEAIAQGDAADAASGDVGEATLDDSGDEASNTVVATREDITDKAEDDEILPDAQIPFGPLGSILPEEYSELEREVVEEAIDELRRRKEDDAKKSGNKRRLTRVRNIVPGPTGFFSLVGSVLQVEDGWEEGLQRLQLVLTRPSKPASINLIEGLSGLISPEAARPLAVMDDTIARMLPGISGVPEELRALGVGPLLHTFLAKSPGLAEDLVDVLSKMGLSSLLK